MPYRFYMTIEGKKQGQLKGSSKVFEIDDFSFDIEQVLNIGSSSSGAGSGKVTFNPFQITKKTDSSSPNLFEACVTGETLAKAVFEIRTATAKGETVVERITLTNAEISKVVPVVLAGKVAHKLWFGCQNVAFAFMSPAVLATLLRR